MIDYLALLAIAAFGWGLSLASYRYVARASGWPMGTLHHDLPAVPTLVGLFALFVAVAFAAERGAAAGGWIIVLFGVLLAVFWTGFFRVGSQLALILAPVAAILLLISWLGEPTPLVYRQSALGLTLAAVDAPASMSTVTVPVTVQCQPTSAGGLIGS